MKALLLILVLIAGPAFADDKVVSLSCDFSAFAKPGSIGPYKNVTLMHCRWPRLDQPTALFAEGTSGLKVMGPPTPRNVIFPPDTEALGDMQLSVFFLRDGDTVSDLTDDDLIAITAGTTLDRRGRVFRPISEPSPKDVAK